MLPRLYAITDEVVLPNPVLLDKAQEVLQAGIRMLQVRFKTTPWEEQIRLGEKLRELTRQFDSYLVVNDSPQLALSIEADGVHLGAGDPDVARAREILDPAKIVGVSCYEDLELVKMYEPRCADYVGVSSPYLSTTKQKGIVDIQGLKSVVRTSKVPVYVIGGITPAKVREIMRTGCHGIAVISAIFGKENPGNAVKEFLSLLENIS